MANFRFTLPVTGVNFLSDDDGDTRSLKRLHPAITTTGIPASFEQTQRVPTGHPNVGLCDVSGATNEAQRASSGGPTRFLKEPLRAQEKTQRAHHPGLVFGSLARCGRPFLGSLAPLVLIPVLAL